MKPQRHGQRRTMQSPTGSFHWLGDLEQRWACASPLCHLPVNNKEHTATRKARKSNSSATWCDQCASLPKHNPSAKDIDGKELLQDIPIRKLPSYDWRREEVILPALQYPGKRREFGGGDTLWFFFFFSWTGLNVQPTQPGKLWDTNTAQTLMKFLIWNQPFCPF